jgi:hypothetical protein
MTFISFKPVRVSPAFVPAPSASFSSTAFRTHVFASGSLARAKLVPTAPAFAFPPVTAAPLRTLFIQMQNTPNPRSLKFLPGREVLPATDSSSAPVASFDASNKTAAKTQSPLAHAILLLDGVTSVMFGADFVTVTTEESADWMVIKPQVFAAITDAYATGQPIVSADAGAGSSQEQPCLPGDEETVELIKEIIDMRVRPSVMEDGGDIEFIKLDEERIVWLLMKGTSTLEAILLPAAAAAAFLFFAIQCLRRSLRLYLSPARLSLPSVSHFVPQARALGAQAAARR